MNALQSTVFCSNCGAQNNSEFKYCTFCGYELIKDTLQKELSILTNNQKDEKSSPTVIINNLPPKSGCSLVAVGYIISFMPILMLPILFTPLGIFIGIVNICKNKEAHGIIQLIIAIVLGAVGVSIGGWGLGI